MELGEIPVGVRRLEINLTTTGADLDVQLYDLDACTGTSGASGTSCTPIIAYGVRTATGLGDFPFYASGVYKGVTYHYSGYNGDGRVPRPLPRVAATAQLHSLTHTRI